MNLRAISGIQPSGTIHLGNYFGAIQQQLLLQNEFPGECLFFIADYHALTTVFSAETLRKNVFDLAATYLALGLDPEKALLFRQSDIPEVTELAWLLATVTGMGLLERGVSYKQKIRRGLPASVGLFTYPVLMAADILIYNSTVVPVGKDQIQHVEMARDMAIRFNETYGEQFELPRYRLSKSPYIPGTDGRKMSKSYGNTIGVFDTGKNLRKKVFSIQTDSAPLGTPLQMDGPLMELIKLFSSEEEKGQMEAYFRLGRRHGEPFGYGHAKKHLVSLIDSHFSVARTHYKYLCENPERVEAVLQKSAKKVRALARETLDSCKKACGLL